MQRLYVLKGPSGIGKTELARTLNQTASSVAHIHLNYVSWGERDLLVTILRSHQKTILLLDMEGALDARFPAFLKAHGFDLVGLTLERIPA